MHLTQLPSGKWRVAVKHHGQRRTATAPSKADARILGAQLLVELGGGGRHYEHNVTVADMMAAMMASGLRRWSPTFAAEAVRVADNLPQTFLERKVRDVTPAVIAGLWRQLERDGWGPHRIKRAHTLLSRAWNDAIPLGWATDNPTRHAHPIPPPPRQVRAPDVDTVIRILKAADTPTERLALRLSAITGARRGEVVALQWDDVDYTGGTLLICRSLVYTKRSGIVERSTKTGPDGHRRIAVDDDTLDMLREHGDHQTKLAIESGLDPVWILSDDAGVTPWRPDRLTHVYIRARQRAGVTGYRLHDLRHHVATDMLQNGIPVIDVAAQLGHRSMQTTQSTYAHFLPGRGREAVTERAARLGR